MRYIESVITDIGNVKETNQDSVCIKIAESKQFGQIAFIMVCDGMGGLSKGELASATLVRAFSSWFEEELPKILEQFSLEVVEKQWNDLIKKQNSELLAYGKKENVELGTTLTAMLFINQEYFIAHVGDTRAYLIKNNIKKLTKDQTFIAKEIEKGNMTQEEAKVDPRRNMLLQCVGASTEVVPEMYRGKIEKNAVYMICSDGFRHVITEEEIFENLCPEVVQTREQMEQNARHLVEVIKSRNERDNITVVLLRTMN